MGGANKSKLQIRITPADLEAFKKGFSNAELVFRTHEIVTGPVVSGTLGNSATTYLD